MPVDPRLCCAAEVCCPPPQARAATKEILREMGVPHDELDTVTAAMDEAGIVLFPRSMAVAVREFTETAGNNPVSGSVKHRESETVFRSTERDLGGLSNIK